MALPLRSSLVQCAACGRSAGVQSNGEISVCRCGSWHFLSLDKAPWRLTGFDYKLLRQNRIDPEITPEVAEPV